MLCDVETVQTMSLSGWFPSVDDECVWARSACELHVVKAFILCMYLVSSWHSSLNTSPPTTHRFRLQFTSAICVRIVRALSRHQRILFATGDGYQHQVGIRENEMRLLRTMLVIHTVIIDVDCLQWRHSKWMLLARRRQRFLFEFLITMKLKFWFCHSKHRYFGPNIEPHCIMPTASNRTVPCVCQRCVPCVTARVCPPLAVWLILWWRLPQPLLHARSCVRAVCVIRIKCAFSIHPSIHPFARAGSKLIQLWPIRRRSEEDKSNKKKKMTTHSRIIHVLFSHIFALHSKSATI